MNPAMFGAMAASTFRSKLSEIRKAARCCSAFPNAQSFPVAPSVAPAAGPSDGLNRIATPAKLPSSSDCATEFLSDDDFLSESSAAQSEDESLENSALTFRPIVIYGNWEDVNEDTRLTLAVLMPSETCKTNKDHNVRVVGSGRVLKISVLWPAAMADRHYLHKPWLEGDPNFTLYHPRLYAFREFLRGLRTSSDEAIYSTCKLRLPFVVKDAASLVRRNTKYIRFSSSGETILYTTLEAPDRNYLAEKEQEINTLTVC